MACCLHSLSNHLHLSVNYLFSQCIGDQASHFGSTNCQLGLVLPRNDPLAPIYQSLCHHGSLLHEHQSHSHWPEWAFEPFHFTSYSLLPLQMIQTPQLNFDSCLITVPTSSPCMTSTPMSPSILGTSPNCMGHCYMEMGTNRWRSLNLIQVLTLFLLLQKRKFRITWKNF